MNSHDAATEITLASTGATSTKAAAGGHAPVTFVLSSVDAREHSSRMEVSCGTLARQRT